jgi:hypothetical protein
VLGEWRYRSTHSLTSALDEGEWSASRPGRFTPRERAPGTHWIGGWLGPRAVLDAVVKRKIPSHCRESNPRTPIVQPVRTHLESACTCNTVLHCRKFGSIINSVLGLCQSRDSSVGTLLGYGLDDRSEADRSPPSSAEVEECVDLYLHSPSTPSWLSTQLKKYRDTLTLT